MFFFDICKFLAKKSIFFREKADFAREIAREITKEKKKATETESA